jgi:hypothetical protein
MPSTTSGSRQPRSFAWPHHETFAGTLSRFHALPQHQKPSSGVQDVAVTLRQPCTMHAKISKTSVHTTLCYTTPNSVTLNITYGASRRCFFQYIPLALCYDE